MAYTPHVITAGSGYGQANGIRVAFGVSIPPTNPNGRKHAAFIWLHGQEARGDTPSSNSDTADLHLVYNKGMPLHVRDADFPRFNIPGTVGAAGELGSVIVAPQCGRQFGTWPLMYPSEMIKWIKANLNNIVDENRIYLVGYSQGGGGCLEAADDAYINANIARLVPIAPGYYISPTHSFVAASGLPIRIYHTITDALAISTSVADPWISGLMAQKPVWPVENIRFKGTTAGTTNHDNIVATVCAKSITGSAGYELSNGEIWIQRETLYEDCFRYSLPRASRAA